MPLNKYMVSLRGDEIIILNPPLRGQSMTREEALEFAAWIVALAEVPNIDGEEVMFKNILKRVQET